MSEKSTTRQVKTLKNGNPINVSAQFGQPNGNPRNPSGWKHADTFRGKMENWAKMVNEDLEAILKQKDTSAFDAGMVNSILRIRQTANTLQRTIEDANAEEDVEKRVKLLSYCTSMIESVVRMYKELTNQIYGMPTQVNENRNIEIQPILPMEES